MKVTALGAALVILAFSPGCDRMLAPARHPVYAAWEEGLTLGYENPQLTDTAQRTQNRQMVRVKEAKPAASGMMITKTFTSFSGQAETRVLEYNGGVRLQAGTPGGILLLPEGFPDRVSRWSTRGTFNWVVGRATADLPGVRFADSGDVTGIWVESISQSDPTVRSRTFYLPDIGEAETMTWDQEHWRWAVTNRLVTRGFTDVPATANPKTDGSPR